MQTIKKLNFIFEMYWLQNLAKKLAMLAFSGFAQSLKVNSETVRQIPFEE
jgi:hypothetical protein